MTRFTNRTSQFPMPWSRPALQPGASWWRFVVDPQSQLPASSGSSAEMRSVVLYWLHVRRSETSVHRHFRNDALPKVFTRSRCFCVSCRRLSAARLRCLTTFSVSVAAIEYPRFLKFVSAESNFQTSKSTDGGRIKFHCTHINVFLQNYVHLCATNCCLKMAARARCFSYQLPSAISKSKYCSISCDIQCLLVLLSGPWRWTVDCWWHHPLKRDLLRAPFLGEIPHNLSICTYVSTRSISNRELPAVNTWYPHAWSAHTKLLSSWSGILFGRA